MYKKLARVKEKICEMSTNIIHSEDLGQTRLQVHSSKVRN